MPAVYRIELAFDGELQHVGLFTGLNVIGLSKQTIQKVDDKFKDLLLPKVYGDNVSFWFTEDGFTEFLPAIKYIRDVLRRHNWQIFIAKLYYKPNDAICKKIIYEDAFQIAIENVPEYELHYQRFDGRVHLNKPRLVAD